MRNLKKVYIKNPDFVERAFDKEMILMPIYRTDTDINSMYTLDEIARSIWELVDGVRTLNEIRLQLLEQYDVSEKKLDEYLTEFFADLRKINAVS